MQRPHRSCVVPQGRVGELRALLGDAERQRELQEAEGRALRQVRCCLSLNRIPPSFPWTPLCSMETPKSSQAPRIFHTDTDFFHSLLLGTPKSLSQDSNPSLETSLCPPGLQRSQHHPAIHPRTPISVLNCFLQTPISVLNCFLQTPMSALNCFLQTPISALNCFLQTPISALNCFLQTPIPFCSSLPPPRTPISALNCLLQTPIPFCSSLPPPGPQYRP